MTKKTFRQTLIILVSLFGVFLFAPKLQAQEPTRIKINHETIQKGYTITYNNNNFRFAVTPGQVDQEVTVALKDITIENPALPNGKKAVSPFYSFDLRGKMTNPIIFKKPSWVAIHFQSENPQATKAIYNWDSNKNAWMKMPSYTDLISAEVRAITHLPYSRVVVLEDINVLEGKASWYSSSRGLVAACNDFSYGTKLKVVNLENNKSVTVTVVSNGPFAEGRVIDLADDAFKLLAPLSEGVINVRVQVEQIEINSPFAVLINSKTGEVLWEKSSNEVRSLASLTKIMTGLVFLDTKTSFDKVVTIETSDWAEGSRLQVNAGETLKVNDLFYAMLVGSANNAANALARSTGLSREEFVNRMNAKAQALGLSHTHFVEPTGLDPANQSTAYEIAIMAKETLKNFVMLQGTTTKEYAFTTINTKVFHLLKNTNKLLNSSLYITGAKTGYLDEAGYCLMSKAKNSNGNEVIAVVLGSTTSDLRFNEMEKLLRWGLGI